MTKTKDDRYYAEAILKEVNRLFDFSSRVDFSDPERNMEAIYAMNFALIQIRSNIPLLSEDFRRNRLGIDADKIINFRNVLVHDYGNTNYAAYRDLLERDMKKLKQSLEEYLY